MGRLDSTNAVIAAADPTHAASLGAALEAAGANVVVASDGSGDEALPTDEAGWLELYRSVAKRFGPLDLVVNLAATPESGTLRDTSLEHFRSLTDAAIDPVFSSSRAAILAFREQSGDEPAKGSVVNVTSFASHLGLARGAVLNALAAGIWNLTRQLGIECGESGERIRLNSVHLGPSQSQAETLGLAGYRAVDAASDLAAAVIYLASDAARIVTAADIVIDGGLTAGR